jgi:hypothetical protein
LKIRKRWWIVAVLAVLAAGVVYLATHYPLGEAADVLAEGGEKQLREPMRPPGPGPRVVVLALDGVGADAFAELVRSPLAPHLSSLMGAPQGEDGVYEHAYSVPGALSILPSTTFAAWASVFTGEPPSRTGVAGNEWFNRAEALFYAPAPVSVSGVDHAVEVYSDNLIGRVLQVPTLFERAQVRSYVALASVYRGADLLIGPSLEGMADMAATAFTGLTGGEEAELQMFAELDLEATESLLESLRKHGVPDLQVIYFAGVDLFTHLAEPPLEKQFEYLHTIVDPAVGRIMEEYRRQGTLGETYFILVSDHGHTPVLNDDRHALGSGDRGPEDVLEQLGFRVRPFDLEIDGSEEHFQAVLAYQGGFAYVYLADRSTCLERGQRCDWRRPPRLQEDVLPVAQAFHRAGATGAVVPEMVGSLDLVFAREPRAAGQEQLPFQVFDGTRLIDIGSYLEAVPRPDLVELESRLEDLAVGPFGYRAGDVLLLARSGMERPIQDRFYFSGLYHSWHGSPSEQDSRVVLTIAHPSSSGADLRSRVQPIVGARPSHMHLVPIVLSMLEREG